jgi:GNAT superfamily N-acetyltransferase
VIRRARPDDLTSIVQLVRALGFAVWFLNFSTWIGRHGIYLEDLFVQPSARGSGYGRALLAELARICVEQNYGRLEWAVLDWNEPALGFYRSLGAVNECHGLELILRHGTFRSGRTPQRG